MGITMGWVVAISLALAGMARAQEVPFTAMAVEDEVQLRAGVGPSYYVVGQLQQGDRLQVREILYGWYKVEPPEGVFSYVSRAFVDAQNDGSMGLVTRDQAQITAGNVKGPGRSYAEQTVLNEGDKVRIVGQEGSFYKIRPPEKAYVFAPPGSLRQVQGQQDQEDQPQPQTDTDQAEASPGTGNEGGEGNNNGGQSSATEAAANEPESEEPAEDEASEAAEQTDADSEAQQSTGEAAAEEAQSGEAAGEDGDSADAASADADNENMTQQQEQAAEAETEAAATEGAAEQPGTTTDEGVQLQTKAVSDTLRQIEQQMLPHFDKPLEEQPLDEMIAAYERAQQQDLPRMDQRITQYRLRTLRHNRRIAEALADIEQVEQNAEPVEVDLSEPERLPRGSYDAVGRVVTSSLYDGDKLPRMYRLVNEKEGATIAYLDPADVNADRYLGEVVGIMGDTRLDTGQNLRVLQVERIDRLNQETNAQAN
jgi:uncharacterized protein YgiM (DUF1202 family)